MKFAKLLKPWSKLTAEAKSVTNLFRGLTQADV